MVLTDKERQECAKRKQNRAALRRHHKKKPAYQAIKIKILQDADRRFHYLEYYSHLAGCTPSLAMEALAKCCYVDKRTKDGSTQYRINMPKPE